MHPGGQQVASCYQPPRPYASQRELMPLSVGCGTARPQPPPPPPSLPHSHNLNASNAMQIMSFRFSIKMLNHYFTLHSGPSRSDQTRFNKQQGRRAGEVCGTWQTVKHTYAPVITALIYCLWFCDINLFIISVGSAWKNCNPAQLVKNNMI